MENQTLDVGRLRHPMERWLLGIAIVGSITLFAGSLLLAIFKEPIVSSFKSESIATYRTENPETAGLPDEEVLALLPEGDDIIEFFESLDPMLILLAPVGFFLLIVWTTGRGYGKLRANAVRITERQFPEVYAMWEGLAQDLGIKEVPDLYTINGNGLLNAYASCVPGFGISALSTRTFWRPACGTRTGTASSLS